MVQGAAMEKLILWQSSDKFSGCTGTLWPTYGMFVTAMWRLSCGGLESLTKKPKLNSLTCTLCLMVSQRTKSRKMLMSRILFLLQKLFCIFFENVFSRHGGLLRKDYFLFSAKPWLSALHQLYFWFQFDGMFSLLKTSTFLSAVVLMTVAVRFWLRCADNQSVSQCLHQAHGIFQH